MGKPKQTDLEEAIAKHQADDYGELHDAFTGEIFKPKSRNHYEANDGVPFAPQVELNRPTLRQRIENLINRDPAVLQRYLQEGPPDGSEGLDMDVPDDPEAPLTASEGNYLDAVAAELAEQAPLPDDGLPRPDKPPATPVPQAPPIPGGDEAALPSASPARQTAAAQAAKPSTEPTR